MSLVYRALSLQKCCCCMCSTKRNIALPGVLGLHQNDIYHLGLMDLEQTLNHTPRLNPAGIDPPFHRNGSDFHSLGDRPHLSPPEVSPQTRNQRAAGQVHQVLERCVERRRSCKTTDHQASTRRYW